MNPAAGKANGFRAKPPAMMQNAVPRPAPEDSPSTYGSASGLISFVGLTIPHATRALVGPDHRRLLPAAACTGAAFLVLADAFGRTLLYPTEIPVGVITALIGGPFFLVILRAKRKEVWIG
jgi:iron complex transport system permease protein